MSENNSTSKFLMIAVIVAIIAGLGYMLLSKSQSPEDASAQQTEQTASAEQTAQPASAEEEKKPVVVETKVLAMPAGQAPNIPTSTASQDPAVEAMMTTRKIGSDNAPVKVVEYSSLTCSHCASFHQGDFEAIKTKYIDTGKVQFIFKEFPLNKPAIDASLLLRCIPEDRYVSFTTLLFQEQGKWAFQQDYLTPLKQNAKLAGLSEEQVESCLKNSELQNRIIGDMKAATEAFKIQSTPTFVINDGAKTIVGHQPLAFFEQTFDSIIGTAAPTEAPATAPAAPASAPAADAPKQ